MIDPVHYAALNDSLYPVGALANRPLCDELTDEISKEHDALSRLPEGHERRSAYLNLKILRRDICLLALGMQELMELERQNAVDIIELKRTNRILENFILDYIGKKNEAAAIG